MNLKSLGQKVADKAKEVSSTVVNTEFSDMKEAVVTKAAETKAQVESRINK